MSFILQKILRSIARATPIILIFLISQYTAKASHAAGGEIAYEWISDSTYKIIFKFYRDCAGVGEPATVSLCYRNTCNSQGGTITLNKISKLPDSSNNGSPVSLGCPSTGTKCTNTSSSVPGYREWWYVNTVTLPSRCNFWRFSLGISARNPSINIAGGNFYAEATLNNVAAQGNSSPFFSVKPVPSVCINQPYTYNNGGVDPNSDSLAFELVQPQNTNIGCPPTTSNLSFNTASPSYNLTTNPIQTNNTFTISSTTGQLAFTPSTTGAGTLTVRIKEYRNGILIGTVMRDIQVQVINCSVTSPIVNTVSNTVTGGTMVGGRIEACAGVPLGFCFDLKSSDTAAIIVASDNSAVAAPGSTVTYIGQRTDSVRGCFSWVPGTLDTGLRVFSVTAKDSTCVSPGVIVAQTFVLPIYIWPITDIIRDTTICYGDSVQLLAVGGSSFTWSVLPGGAPISTLSCTTCKQPYAKPLVNTQYTVMNSSTQYCSKNRDTVTVNVLDIRNDTLTASSNTPVCQGDTLKLFSSAAAPGFGYKWTGPNSFSSTLQNPVVINVPVANSGNYILSSSKSGCFSGKDTTVVLVKPKPTTPTLTNNGPLCTGNTLNLTASTATGVSYSWTGPNSFTSTTQNPSISNVQLIHAGSYSAITSLNGCNSSVATTNVVVNVKPIISSYSFTNPTTCSGTNGSIVLSGLANSTSYTVEYFKNAILQSPIVATSSSTGNVTMTGLGAGTYSQITVRTAFCRSDTIAPIILSNPNAPVVAATNNSPICAGDTLKLFGTSDSTGVTWAWSGPLSYTSTSQNPIIVSASTTRSGVYSLTASKNNCTAIAATTTVVVNAKPAAPTISNNGPLCTGSTLNLTASAVAGATYTWAGPNGFSSSLQNPSLINVQLVNAGVYNVYTSQNGCNSLTTPATTVVVNPKPVISGTTFTNPTTCSGSNGTITLLGLLNTTNYTVNYRKNGVVQTPLSLTSSSSGNVLINGLTAGTYSQITVTSLACASDTTLPLILSDPSAPVVTANSNTPVCQSDTLKLFATADSSGVTWAWSGPLSFTSTTQNPVITNAIPTQSGMYSVTASKNNCTSVVATTTVLVNPTPSTPTAGNNGPLCKGGTLQLSSSTVTNASYSWTGPLSFTSNVKNPSITNVDTPNSGKYIVRAIVNGCYSLPDTTVVSIYSIPAIDSFSYTHPTSCLGTNGSITLKGMKPSTPYVIDYRKNGVVQSSLFLTSGSNGNIVMTGLSAGIYSRIVAILNGCTSDTLAPIVLIDPKAPVVTANNNTPICQGDTVFLTSTSDSSGVTWSWTGPLSFTSAIQNPVITNSIPSYSGVYSVTATKNNCISIAATTTVLIKPTPPTPLAGSNSPLCKGSTLMLSTIFIANAVYSWTGPLSFTSAIQNPSISNVDTPNTGNYVVKATVNGCVSLPDTVAVAVYHVPSIDSFSFLHPTACSTPNGSITLKGLRPNTTYSINYKKNNIVQSTLSLTSAGTGNILISSLVAGAYSQITATLNGCTSDTLAPIILIDPLAPVVNATNNTPICEGDTLKLFATSDSTGVIWTWTGPLSYSSSSQNPVITNALPARSGIYILTASKNNCTSIPDSTIVLVKPTPATPVANNNSPLCAGSTLLLTSSTILNATYSWTGPNSFISTIQNPVITNADTAATGNYIVTATINGCKSIPDTTMVNVYHIPSIDSFSSIHPSTCLGTDGSITLKGMKPNTTYTINYKKNGLSQTALSLTSGGTGNVIIGGLGYGIYTGIMATLNGCSSDTLGTIILVHPATPVATAGSNSPICQGTTLQLFGSADSSGVTWSWTGPGGFTSASQNPVITGAIPAQSGVYSVTATKNNCISFPASTTVLVKPTPSTPTASNNTPICAGSTLQLTSSTVTNATYSWTGPNSYTASVQNPSIVNADTFLNGTYSVIATINGCQSLPGNTIVLINHIPSIDSFSFTNPTTCLGTDGAITLKGMRPATTYSISYKKNGVAQTALSLTSGSNGTILMSGLTAGLYSQIKATLSNCTSDTIIPILLTDPRPPVITAGNNTPICQGATILLSATSDSVGVLWAWSGPLGFTSTSQNPSISNSIPTQSGVYTVIATKNGCTSVPATTTVLVRPTPATPIAGSNSPLCSSSTLQLTSSTVTNATYNWTGPVAFTAATQNPTRANVDTFMRGDYIVVASVNGCPSIPDTVTVIIYHLPTIDSFSFTHPTTCAGSDGSITLKGMKPNTIYTVNYKKNSITQPTLSLTAAGNGNILISGLTAGTYSSIRVTLNNCTSDSLAPITLNDPIPPAITAVYTNPTTCLGTQGTITITGLINGTSYTVNYSKNSIPQTPLTLTAGTSGTITIIGLNAGLYSNINVAVNNCISNNVGPFGLQDPTPPVTALDVFSNPTTCLGTEGSITLKGLISGNTYTVNYTKNAIGQTPVSLFANTLGTITITGLTAGTYANITVTINNCISNIVGPVVLTDPIPPVVSNSNNTPICQGDTIKLFANSVPGVTYLWNGPGSYSSVLQNPILTGALPSQSGMYIVRATINNCTSVPDTTIVVVHPTPGIPTARSNSPICTGNTLLLFADTIASATYSWIGPNSFTSSIQNPVLINAQPILSGIYTVTATVNGCVSPSSSTTVVVFALPAPIVTGFAVTNPTTCLGNNGSIVISGLAGNVLFIVNYKKNGIAQAPLSITSSIVGSVVITGLTAGVYSDLTVTAPNGCNSDPLLPITLSDPIPPTITYITKNNPTTCLGSNGSITVGGLTPNQTYSINYTKNTVAQPPLIATADGSGRIIISGLSSGTYSNFTATVNNCTSNIIGPFTLNDPNAPVVVATNNTPICEGDIIRLFATSDSSAVTWSWTGPNLYTSSLQNPTIPGALPTQSGIYSLTATKNNCTSLPATTNVIVKPTPPTPVATNNGPLCEGDDLQLFASSITNATYVWVGPMSFTNTTQFPNLPSITTANAGVYTVIATVNGCVSLPGSTNVIINPVPLAPLANTLINYCQDDVSVPLTATGNNLIWYTVPFGGIGSTIAPTPPTNIPGNTYWYVSQKNSNCEGPRTRIQVIIRSKPLLPTAPDSFLYCQYAKALPLQVTGSYLRWYTQAQGGAGSTTVPIPSTAVPGVYKWYVTQTGFNGCESNRKEITVIVIPEIKPDIFTDRYTICQNDTIILKDTTTYYSTVSHTWDFNGATILSGDTSGPYKIIWKQAGNKTVKVKVSNGNCDGYDSISILVNPVPDANFILANDACLDEKVKIELFKQQNIMYQWMLDGGILVDSVKNESYTAVWKSVGNKVISLRTISTNGCISEAMVDTIAIHELPIAKIENISKNGICTGDTIEVIASAYNDHLYSWYGNAYFINSNYNKTFAQIPQTGFVYVTVNNIWGCEATDSVFVNTESCCELVLPNVFSPNGDGKNDKFRVITLGNHTIKKFIIVNRWGQKVFETTNQKDAWDGTFNGVQQDLGTYHYYLKYTCSDGRSLEMKGQVILLR